MFLVMIEFRWAIPRCDGVYGGGHLRSTIANGHAGLQVVGSETGGRILQITWRDARLDLSGADRGTCPPGNKDPSVLLRHLSGRGSNMGDHGCTLREWEIRGRDDRADLIRLIRSLATGPVTGSNYSGEIPECVTELLRE
jgi:hypothetical protein